MAETKRLDYLKIINSSIQNKTYSFAIFTIIVVIILLIGAIRPTLLTITKINKDIKDKKYINEQLDLKLDNLGTLSNLYSNISFDAKALPLLFPTHGNFSLFMSNVEDISKANGYTLSHITFGGDSEFDMNLTTLKPWSVRLTVVGNRSNIVKLLKAYESMPMYPVVNKLNFGEADRETRLTQYSVELLIFRIDDPKFYID
ncbi:hypothetical protein HYV12_04460 [Candidatus Dojkabacteria bacterium]|nr:hypothetical protein [Candidatus Dojkabacteria bacterium]